MLAIAEKQNANSSIVWIFESSENRIDFIVELVSSNPTVFSNTLKMIDLFSYITFIEYHHVQTNIVLRLIRSMFKPSFKCDVNQYFDILINFICFHMRIKKKEERGNCDKDVKYKKKLD